MFVLSNNTIIVSTARANDTINAAIACWLIIPLNATNSVTVKNTSNNKIDEATKPPNL